MGEVLRRLESARNAGEKRRREIRTSQVAFPTKVPPFSKTRVMTVASTTAVGKVGIQKFVLRPALLIRRPLTCEILESVGAKEQRNARSAHGILRDHRLPLQNPLRSAFDRDLPGPTAEEVVLVLRLVHVRARETAHINPWVVSCIKSKDQSDNTMGKEEREQTRDSEKRLCGRFRRVEEGEIVLLVSRRDSEAEAGSSGLDVGGSGRHGVKARERRRERR